MEYDLDIQEDRIEFIKGKYRQLMASKEPIEQKCLKDMFRRTGKETDADLHRWCNAFRRDVERELGKDDGRFGDLEIHERMALIVFTGVKAPKKVIESVKGFVEFDEKDHPKEMNCKGIRFNCQYDPNLYMLNKKQKKALKGKKNEQSAALEEAKSEIALLREKLIKAEAEVDRLEKVCDDLDEDEKKWKAKIRELKAENKKLKGVKSPPKTLGLLQQARLNVQPLSRESSHVEPPSTEDGFGDAHDSFQSQTQQNPQKSFNVTARGTDTSRLAAAGSTMLHPDDQAVEKTMVETLSKKNRPNCQQQ